MPLTLHINNESGELNARDHILLVNLEKARDNHDRLKALFSYLANNPGLKLLFEDSLDDPVFAYFLMCDSDSTVTQLLEDSLLPELVHEFLAHESFDTTVRDILEREDFGRVEREAFDKMASKIHLKYKRRNTFFWSTWVLQHLVTYRAQRSDLDSFSQRIMLEGKLLKEGLPSQEKEFHWARFATLLTLKQAGFSHVCIPSQSKKTPKSWTFYAGMTDAEIMPKYVSFRFGVAHQNVTNLQSIDDEEFFREYHRRMELGLVEQRTDPEFIDTLIVGNNNYHSFKAKLAVRDLKAVRGDESPTVLGNYKVTLARGAPPRHTLYGKRVLLPISIGGPEHENGRMDATLKYVTELFGGPENVFILVDDSVQLPTYQIRNPHTEVRELLHLALEAGKSWVDRNRRRLERYGISVETNVIHWDYFRLKNNPNDLFDFSLTYKYNLRRVEEAYAENTEYEASDGSIRRFRDEIDANRDEFLRRFLVKNDSVDREHAREHTQIYLLRECAGFMDWHRLECEYEVYPSGRNRAMTAAFDLFVRHEHPGLLTSLGLRIDSAKQYYESVVSTSAGAAPPEAETEALHQELEFEIVPADADVSERSRADSSGAQTTGSLSPTPGDELDGTIDVLDLEGMDVARGTGSDTEELPELSLQAGVAVFAGRAREHNSQKRARSAPPSGRFSPPAFTTAQLSS